MGATSMASRRSTPLRPTWQRCSMHSISGRLSMGGYVLMALWRRQPRLITGMILADTRSGADSSEARASREKMLHELTSDDGPAVIATEVIPKLLGETTRRNRPDIVDLCRQRIEAQPAE